MELSGDKASSMVSNQLTAKDSSQCTIGTNLHEPLYPSAMRFDPNGNRNVWAARPRCAIQKCDSYCKVDDASRRTWRRNFRGLSVCPADGNSNDNVGAIALYADLGTPSIFALWAGSEIS